MAAIELLPQQQAAPRRDEAGGAAVNRLAWLAHWMDSAFRVPGLGLRFGLDAIIGLVPGAGDLTASLASVYILAAAGRQGVPRITLVRMTLNTVVDVVIGAIPLVGDVFDAWWKVNNRNVELVRRHVLAAPAEARKLRMADRLFVAALVGAVVVALVGSLWLTYLIVAWLVAALGGS